MDEVKPDNPTNQPIPPEYSTLGQIKINHSVVASIVRLSALEVPSVYSVGGGFVDGLAEIFSKKESDRGVRVTENEAGNYIVEVRVVLHFGVELAGVAEQIQRNVTQQVAKMTQKTVERVDVIIDGIKAMPSNKPAKEKLWSEEYDN